MTAVRRSALAFLVLGLVVAAVAGCSRSSPATSTASAPASTAAAQAVQAAGAATAGDSSSNASSPGSAAPSQNVEALDKPPAQTGRQIVSSATLTVQVDDVVAAKQKAEALVTGLEPSNVLFAEQTSLPPGSSSAKSATSTVTFKVAPSKFEEALGDLAGLGTLASQEVKTDDVTQQVVDLDARVKAAEQSAARVADLVNRTTSLTELATLENEVEKRQADLESLRGQQRTLAARTELATVVVTFSASVPPPATAETAKPLPGFLDGLHNGWDAFVNVLTVVGAVTGALLPFAWVPVIVYLLWRLTRRRDAKPAAPAAAS
jgi:hypothetical protein